MIAYHRARAADFLDGLRSGGGVSLRGALAGVLAILALLATRGAEAQGGTTRHYYIGAEEVVWDYALGGKALLHAGHAAAIPKLWGQQTRWKKVRFVEYTDGRGLMHTVNGFIFGTLPPPAARVGERVRWYLLGMGNEKDLHTLHWHGKTLRLRGRSTDVVELLPGSMATADMIADNPGTWLMHCHVADHFNAGMLATYTITP